MEGFCEISRDDLMEMGCDVKIRGTQDELQFKLPPVIVYGMFGPKWRSIFSCLDDIIHGKKFNICLGGSNNGRFCDGRYVHRQYILSGNVVCMSIGTPWNIVPMKIILCKDNA